MKIFVCFDFCRRKIHLDATSPIDTIARVKGNISEAPCDQDCGLNSIDLSKAEYNLQSGEESSTYSDIIKLDFPIFKSTSNFQHPTSNFKPQT